MIAQAETYALARAILLAWCGAPSLRIEGEESPAAFATAAWDLAAAFVAEAQRRQPEAWAVPPAPTKESP